METSVRLKMAGLLLIPWAHWHPCRSAGGFSRYGIYLACMALIVITVGGAGGLAWHLHQRTVAEYQRDAKILGTVLAERTTRYIQVADHVLQELQQRVQSLNVRSPEDFQMRLGTSETQTFLRERMQNLPPANAFVLVDALGRIASASRDIELKGTDVSDADYVRHFATNDDPELFVSITRTSKITGQPAVFLARRINAPDGEFLGVVVGVIDVADLRDFHQAVNVQPGQAVTLLRRDGIVLTSDPDPVREVGQRMAAGSPWYGVVQAGGGSFRSPGLLAGSTATVSVHPLHGYRLVVNVSTQEHDGLAMWRRDAGIIAVATAWAVAGLLVLFGVIGGQMRRMAEQNAVLQRTAADLRESEQQAAKNLRMLQATLEHMDQGLIMIDAERRVPICNRRAIETLDLAARVDGSGAKVRGSSGLPVEPERIRRQ